MKWIRRTLLYMSLTILVGHSIVPHIHTTLSSASTHQSSNEEWWSIVLDFFGTDVGNQHLEKFNLSEDTSEMQQISLELDLVSICAPIYRKHNPVSTGNIDTHQFHPPLFDHLSSSINLRGSPLS